MSENHWCDVGGLSIWCKREGWDYVVTIYKKVDDPEPILKLNQKDAIELGQTIIELAKTFTTGHVEPLSKVE